MAYFLCGLGVSFLVGKNHDYRVGFALILIGVGLIVLKHGWS